MRENLAPRIAHHQWTRASIEGDDARMKVTGLHIDDDQVVGREGGFLAIRRLHLRNVRDDGSRSPSYLCDFAIRPYGLDAVVVVIWRRAHGRIEVLVRDALRPPLALGRDPERQTVPDARAYLHLTELVAGILEAGDRGPDGLRHRAAEEVREEAGYTVDAAAVIVLGAASFPSPGSLAEKFHFLAVEVDPAAAATPPAGDGSPMEEGALIRWLDLDEALASCTRGDIEDLKTEVGLRRFADWLREE
jgi:ADP-ribose pyrophosphatase